MLKYPKWDVVKEKDGQLISRAGHYERKPLPFRYSWSGNNHWEEKDGQVLIPISARLYKMFYMPASIVALLIGLTLLYLCVAIPAKILIRVSRGDIFTSQNVRQLHIAAWAFLLPPFVVIVLQYVFKWIFHRYITADVNLSAWRTLSDCQVLLIAGLVILAIAKAFKKGLSLQKEQDLTI
jgi:uncharacterized membrane protein